MSGNKNNGRCKRTSTFCGHVFKRGRSGPLNIYHRTPEFAEKTAQKAPTFHRMSAKVVAGGGEGQVSRHVRSLCLPKL